MTHRDLVLAGWALLAASACSSSSASTPADVANAGAAGAVSSRGGASDGGVAGAGGGGPAGAGPAGGNSMGTGGSTAGAASAAWSCEPAAGTIEQGTVYPYDQVNDCFGDLVPVPAGICIVRPPPPNTAGLRLKCFVSPDTTQSYWARVESDDAFCSDGWYGESSPECGGMVSSDVQPYCIPADPSKAATLDPGEGCPACPGVSRSCP